MPDEEIMTYLTQILNRDLWRTDPQEYRPQGAKESKATSLDLPEQRKVWAAQSRAIRSSTLRRRFLQERLPVKNISAAASSLPLLTISFPKEDDISEVVAQLGHQLKELLDSSDDETFQKMAQPLYAETKNNLQHLPHRQKRTYSLTSDLLLHAYDLPQLSYLIEVRKSCAEAFPSGRRKEILRDDLEFYSLISSANYYPTTLQNSTSWFGIQFDAGTLAGCTELQLPVFCDAGRKEAFLRLVAMRGRLKNAHAFQYHMHGASTPHPLLGDVFCSETAWYFEMCTGISLTVGLTSLFLRLRQECDAFYGSFSPRHKNPLWGDCMEKVFLDLLRSYQALILYCPAVYWRIAYLREVFAKLNQLCLSLETLKQDFPSLARQLCDPIGLGVYGLLGTKIPESEEDWAAFVQYMFSQYVSALQFDIEPLLKGDLQVARTFDLLTEFYRHVTPRFSLYNLEPAYPAGIQMSCAELSDPPKNPMHRFGYAILPNEPGICTLAEKAAKYASLPSCDEGKKEKIRNRSEEERLYRTIHETLYSGGGTQQEAEGRQDLGFLDLPCI